MLDEKDLQAISDLIDKKLDIRFQDSEARMMQRLQDSEARTLQQLQDSETRTLEQSAQNMRVILESYIEPKFKLLAEGQQLLLETLAPKSRVDELDEEVAFLKSMVRIHDRDIQELKKAQ